MIGRVAAASAAVLLLAGCASADGLATATGPPTLAEPIGAHDVVIVTPAAAVIEISPSGHVIRTLAHLPLTDGVEVDAVDVSPDGRRVLVSTLDDSDEGRTCKAHVYGITAAGSLHSIADGADAAWSPDGTRIAYLHYGLRRGFCMRVELRVRTVATGAERARGLAAGPVLEGTPPQWPLNWSPDSTRVAYVGADGISIATVQPGWSDAALRARAGALAPVFLDDATVGALTGCCTGTEQVRRFPIAGTGSRALFDLPSPIRSIRRARGASELWFTTEPAPHSLWHWDGSSLRHLTRQALVTSG